ncbi:hypothetical protein GGS23DRAFT_350668 [Durotheca rogersii]|uniref:uncharacterized protein n=1 Tax=Durotheca rogersii TaxID=419775 RepID=UPI00221E68AF|nr:uncharacterized protein GGS23DRAFT_350668 [Durotheca rogersii]KAI5865690.1 hypothetical protein GGS23DRAFT_350668 [Durotheca rogersii]
MALYSSERAPGKEHIPLYPKGFIAIRIVQLIIGIICLGLSAFGVSALVFAGDALMLFTAIVTLISTIYCLVAHFGPPKAFNYWAILGLDIFLVIFWLISFAVLASQVATLFSLLSNYIYYYSDIELVYTVYSACLAAAAGLGGVEFLLYIVSLSIHGVMLHRHRGAGLRAMPIDLEKIQMQPQAAQGYPPQFVAANEPPPTQPAFHPTLSSSPAPAQQAGSLHYPPQQVNPGQQIYQTPGQNPQYYPAP